MPVIETKTQVYKKLRVLVAKIGLDGHDRGVKIVARALRDGGIEVIYLGIHNTPQDIVSSAIQEDVDAIGLSLHSAAHMTLLGQVMKLLKKNKSTDIVVFAGGIVPDEDITKLKRIGVREIFTPGAPLEKIVSFVKSLAVLKLKRSSAAQRVISPSSLSSRRQKKHGTVKGKDSS